MKRCGENAPVVGRCRGATADGRRLSAGPVRVAGLDARPPPRRAVDGTSDSDL